MGSKNIVFPSRTTVLGSDPSLGFQQRKLWSAAALTLYVAPSYACEAMLSAYAHTFDLEARYFGLLSVVGRGITTGLFMILSATLNEHPIISKF